MTVDIRQVAAEAGVSTATVSRVLSGKGPASAEARRKVRQAAERLHYLPNASASSLRTDRSMIIGVLLPNLGNPVFLPFLRAVEEIAQGHGYSVIVADTQRRAEIERRQLDRLLTRRIDALIMAGRPGDPEYVRRLGGDRMPIVDPTSLVDPGQSTVTPADDAIVEACGHLASLGHRRIGFLVRGALRATSRQRWDLIATACASFGTEASLVRVEDGGDRNHDDGGGTAALVGNLMAGAEPPSALWSNSHVLAPRVLEGLARADIGLPGDCSFLTFGDSPWAAAYRPPINVIASDLAAAASVMTRSVLHRLGVLEDAPDPVIPPDAYRRRGSVGPAAAG